MNPTIRTNHQALGRAFAHYAKSANPRSVMLLTPSKYDVDLVRATFQTARIFVATRKTWDLNRRFPSDGTVDLLVVSNVFHYSPDPALWFENVLGMTTHCIVQDLIFRRRSASPDGLNKDPADGGDSVRYSFESRGERSEFASPFDLSALENQIEYFEAYDGARNEYHVDPAAPPRHFCAVIKSGIDAQKRPLTPAERNYWRFRMPGLLTTVRSKVHSEYPSAVTGA